MPRSTEIYARHVVERCLAANWTISALLRYTRCSSFYAVTITLRLQSVWYGSLICSVRRKRLSHLAHPRLSVALRCPRLVAFAVVHPLRASLRVPCLSVLRCPGGARSGRADGRGEARRRQARAAALCASLTRVSLSCLPCPESPRPPTPAPIHPSLCSALVSSPLRVRCLVRRGRVCSATSTSPPESENSQWVRGHTHNGQGGGRTQHERQRMRDRASLTAVLRAALAHVRVSAAGGAKTQKAPMKVMSRSVHTQARSSRAPLRRSPPCLLASPRLPLLSFSV